MTQTAQVKNAPRLSAVWLIPLLALIVGGWMLLQYQLSKGESIYITMLQADGIVAGKTEIKVRSVQVGLVDAIRLADNQKQVIVRAKIDKNYGKLLTKDAKIWVVKPRIDESGISGLGTLLSGVYLELAPGESSTLVSQFELQDEPALISSDIKGTRFKLTSHDAEVIEVSTGIYYKGYKIGQVETASFDWQRQAMRYGIFINEPYQNLVTLNSIFWVNSGIEVDLSADGISVKTGSLSKLLKGGISVGLPEDTKPGALVSNGHEFSLSTSYKAALEQRFYNFDYYLIHFEQSIRGLRAGAPVEYRGMRIGTVVEAPAVVLINGKPAYFDTDITAVPTLIKIEYGRIYHDAEKAREFWQGHLQKWLKKGMRASLKPGNLLTGAMYVDFDIYPDAPKAQITKMGHYKVFPSTSSGITVLANQVSDVLNKVENLKVEQSLANVDAALEQYEQLAKDLRHFVNAPATAQLPAQFTKDMEQISQSMQQFKSTMASFQEGSAFQQELQTTLKQVQRLLDELQPLSRGLNEQPDMLIFDKDLPKDPTPRSKK